MPRGGEFLIEPTSDRDVWLTSVTSLGFKSDDSDDFVKASARASEKSGIKLVEVSFASRVVSRSDRTCSNIRVDGKDFYKALFQMSGRSTLIQNDRVGELAVGEGGFIDMARPSAILTNNSRWVALYLPRRELTAHLGLEPRGGMTWNGALAASRLLFQFVSDAFRGDDPSRAFAEPYMQFAIYDLLGAILSGSDLDARSHHSEKLFARACRIARNRFSDPDLSIQDVANEAGISLRYLQKLFTARGTTCNRYVQSLRLHHAARLLRHRKLTSSKQPLTDIAHACGFGDYAHFSRTFRHRFGCTPTAYGDDMSGGSIVDTELERGPHTGGHLD